MEESANQQLDLPPEASHYDFRIAGHTHIKGKIKLGVLKHKNGNMLKPLLNEDPRSLRELSFYQNVQENCESDPILGELKHFIPSFYGTLETAIDKTDIKYLCIEDVCGTFQKPCVLDVKIGAVAYDHLASEEKIMREKKKYPAAEIFGFRILGMKVYDFGTDQYTSIGKGFGVSLTTDEAVRTGLGNFFQNKLDGINSLIISGFLHQLMLLKSWFSKQQKFVFIGSSILFVYEGNLSLWITWMEKNCPHRAEFLLCQQLGVPTGSSESTFSHYNTDCNPGFSNSDGRAETISLCSDCYLDKVICNKLQKNCSLLRISMLDFAHVFPTTEEDSNYIFGLNSLIAYFQQLLKTPMET